MAISAHPIDEILFNPSPETAKNLENLRVQISDHGLDEEQDSSSSSRLYAWLVLLRTNPISYEQYAALLERGASPAYPKIQDDVHRTLATDRKFAKRVTQHALTRLLNTIAWSTRDRLTTIASETPLPPSPTLEPQHDDIIPQSNDELPRTPREGDQPKTDLYVQGMNVLAAPLLFVARSEPAAYSMMQTLLQDQIPTYFSPGLAGVHVGLNLLQEILLLVDPELAAHLPPVNTYAMGPIMTLCASVPPLSEVLLLWDYLLATGVHMVVLCVASMVIGMRDQLLAVARASTVLGRSLGPLDARKTIEVVKSQIAPAVFADSSLGNRLISHTRVASLERP